MPTAHGRGMRDIHTWHSTYHKSYVYVHYVTASVRIAVHACTLYSVRKWYVV